VPDGCRRGRHDSPSRTHPRSTVQVNLEIMRAFVRLCQMLQQNTELARKLAHLEKKCDIRFRAVFLLLLTAFVFAGRRRWR
jgi:hypothetical protein